MKNYNAKSIKVEIKSLNEWKDKAKRILYKIFGQEELNNFVEKIRRIDEKDEYHSIGGIKAFHDEKETYLKYLGDLIAAVEKTPELWIERRKGIFPRWSVAIIGILLICGIMWALYRVYKTPEERAMKADQQQEIAAPNYYLISKDAIILKNIKFDQYGLFVKRDKLPRMEADNGELVTTYIIRFNKPPTDFDVIPQEAATRKIEQINANEYKVQFYSGAGGWFGPHIIECNFRIQVY